MEFIRLTQSHPIKHFDCADADLNDYFLNNCKDQQRELMSVTYILENENETIAFFSLLNDKISIDPTEKKKWYKVISKNTPHSKIRSSYPAMKIGRLGVHNAHKGQKVGTMILDYLKQLFIDNNRTGCRYITVDAYKQSLSFYEKNGFLYLTEKDEQDGSRLMYYDLKRLFLEN